MLEVLDKKSWTPAAAAHLLNRAGFGGTPAEIAGLHALGLEGAVDRLLNAGDDADLFPEPPAADPAELLALRDQLRGKAEPEKQEIQRQMRQIGQRQMQGLRSWWLNRMRWSPFAAREKAVLFWHGHWATSVEKVREPFAMWQQNETLRAFALGNFAEMAREISRDPAMMRYLDVNQSNKGRPNENFARELMELFTLGEGNYTEKDIQEAARAFTGYKMNPRSGQFIFAKRQNDDGEKTFFGKTGKFTGDDIIGMIVADPRCPAYMARKLWTFYASENPSPDLVAALSGRYRASGMNTGALLRTIFLSREFYDPSVVRRQIKGPVQWLVQTCRVLEVPLPAEETSDGILRQLGQMPFAPPNVKGWDGGKAWISSASLLLRYNLAGFIVSGKASALQGIGGGQAGALKVPLDKLIPPGMPPEAACDALGFRLFQVGLPEPLKEKFLTYLRTHGTGAPARRDLLHLMMSTPDYQLT